MSNTPDINSTKKLLHIFLLEEMESEVIKLFPKDKFAEGKLHMDLLGALPLRMMMRGGLEKEELLEIFKNIIDKTISLMKEIGEEKLSNS
jgi:hypothetical protein